MSIRQLLVAAGAMAGVAVLTAGYVALVVATGPGPTPEELAERFSVWDGKSANPNVSVASRIMALDASGDTYVARQELPERMQGLMRGDQNRDGLLSTREVLALVDQTPPRRPPLPEAFRGKGHVTLSDVVSDLRLSPAKHRLAMYLLKSPAAQPPLDVRLRTVLDDEEYENFVAAAARIGIRLF